MKNLTIATAAAATLAGAFVGLATPALAAPSVGDAQSTISQLEADGNRVVVNNPSGTPLSQATVVGVNPGGDIRSTIQGDDSSQQQTITGKVYYVDIR
ncbi:hypothetical protein FHR72_002661 [Mycolicibacterium iranicum]|uniref:Uncharacterized protein n=1 Tax=Mycolicibacterium iranicum TaxID=912594 RepID=A0A839Q696_MYCIR|nr:hypothetical protein [Mycolicibacterium iranicum]MBB2991177.1 hypothetical protein [Mycolicibacterium iranicum]